MYQELDALRPEEATLDRALRTAAQRWPTATFLRTLAGDAVTFSQAYDAARKSAEGLHRAGVRPRDRVIISAGPSWPALRMWLAINLLGATDVWLNDRLRGKPLEHAVVSGDATFAIVDAQARELVEKVIHRTGVRSGLLLMDDEELREVVPLEPRVEPSCCEFPRLSPCDVASVLFTSGSSGPAKGVLMPHAHTYLLARVTVEGLRLGPDDVIYCFHPMFHIAGRFMGVYACLLSGAQIVVDSKFDARTWLDRARSVGATSTMAHGPMMEMMYAQPEREDDAEHSITRMMAVPTPTGIGEDFIRRFGIAPVDAWGSTEAGAVCWHDLDEAWRPGCCGKPRDEYYELRIVDESTGAEVPPGEPGHLLVRNKVPNGIMQGYLGRDDATVEAWRDLWFRTGDRGYRDEDGYVYMLGRLSERIRRRAENISPSDIENAVIAHDSVAECVAVGAPSEYENDEDVRVFVVLEPGRDLQPLELLEFAVAQLPPHMVPRYIEIVDEIPRTPTRKIERGVLKRREFSAVTWDRRAQGVNVREIAERLSRDSQASSAHPSAEAPTGDQVAPKS